MLEKWRFIILQTWKSSILAPPFASAGLHPYVVAVRNHEVPTCDVSSLVWDSAEIDEVGKAAVKLLMNDKRHVKTTKLAMIIVVGQSDLEK